MIPWVIYWLAWVGFAANVALMRRGGMDHGIWERASEPARSEECLADTAWRRL